MRVTKARVKCRAVIRIVGGFLLAAAFLAVSGWLLTGPMKGSAHAFDGSIRTAIRAMHSLMWTALFLTVTKLGSTIYLALIGAAVGLIFVYLRWFRALGLFILAMIGQAALHHGFKILIARPRPAALMNYPAVESFSFPSGHALAGACFYATVCWLVTNRLENPAVKAIIWISTLLLILLVGLSRAYIGVHHPTDVLAGFIAAAIWTAAVVSVDERKL